MRHWRLALASLAVLVSVCMTGFIYRLTHAWHVGYVGIDTLGWMRTTVIAGVWLLGAALPFAVARVLRVLPDQRLRRELAFAGALLIAEWLVLQPLLLSSDVFRYLWDGRLFVHGVNPFQYVPVDRHLARFRLWPEWPHMAYKTWTTAYPPGAQLEFAVNAWLLGGGVLGWKVLQWCNYACMLGLFYRILQTRGWTDHTEQAFVVTALFSPLLVEGLGAGHIDLAALPWLLGAWLFSLRSQWWRAGIVLGVAVSIKLYPIVLLAAFAQRRDWRGLWRLTWGCLLAVGVLTLPFLADPRKLIVYEAAFRHFSYNGSVQAVLAHLFGQAAQRWSTALAALTELALGLALFWTRAGKWSIERKATALLLTLFLLSPAVHPWYLLIVIPFAAVAGNAAGLWWAASAFVAYLGQPLLLWFEYVPVFLLFLRKPSKWEELH